MKDCDAFSPCNHFVPEEANHMGTYVSFDAEFKTWKPPEGEVNTETSVYCAAEIFRFLRDMALDIPLAQSKLLLQVSADNMYGSPGNIRGTAPAPLVHPGAVLCMVDLLPAINIDYGSPGPTPCLDHGQEISEYLYESPAHDLSLANDLGAEERTTEKDESDALVGDGPSSGDDVTIHQPPEDPQGRGTQIDLQHVSGTGGPKPAISTHTANSQSPSGSRSGVLEHCDSTSGEEWQVIGDLSKDQKDSSFHVTEDEAETRDNLVEGSSSIPKDIKKVPCVYTYASVYSVIKCRHPSRVYMPAVYSNCMILRFHYVFCGFQV